MAKYTVIVQSRNGEPHQYHVDAHSAENAQDKAETNYYAMRGRVYGKDDLGTNIVAIFEGHLKNLALE